MSDLVPYLEEGVPGAGADRHAVLCDAQTGHSVVVSSQNSCTLRSQSVPHVTVEVVVPSQQEPAGLAERYTGDAADDVVVAVHGQLLITSYIEHSAGGVITARSKSETIGEKLQV